MQMCVEALMVVCTAVAVDTGVCVGADGGEYCSAVVDAALGRCRRVCVGADCGEYCSILILILIRIRYITNTIRLRYDKTTIR